MIAVLFDGATNCSILEVEIVYTRIVKDGHVREFFTSLEDIQHANAEGVFQAVERALLKEEPNWKDKIIGAGSDGASVNIGRNNSVATRIKDGRPYVVFPQCVAHRLELGALEAVKENHLMGVIHDILKRVHKHYHYSPKALRELKMIAEQLDEKVIKPTRLSGTRWIPHIYKACKTILASFTVIVAHFEHVSQAPPGQATAEVRGRATWLVQKFRDWRILRFMFFMQDLLEVVGRLSLRFQDAKATCVDFLDALETANLELIALQQEPGVQLAAFYDAVQWEGDQAKYKDLPLHHAEQNIANDDLSAVIDLVLQKVNGRLEAPGDPTKNIIKLGQVFDTRLWPRTRNELALYGNEDVRQISEHFAVPLARSGCRQESVQQEWTQVKAHLGNRIINNQHPETIPKISSIYQGNQDRFRNIMKVINIILTIPVSSSSCERGFSCVKRVKSDWRSNLTTSMMNHLLTISIEGPDMEEYHCERALQMWWDGARRRPNFVDPEDRPDDDGQEDELLQHLIAVGLP